MSPFDLPADLRSRLRRVALTPRSAATLAHDGAHDSRNKGGTLEFAQYRAYERGDDLRRIDWKLYARSDKLFVRDDEREAPVALWLIVDTSASMGQSDLARPDWSRLDAARRLVAAALDIAGRQGDRVGLVAATARGPMVLSPGSGRAQVDRIRLALAPLSAQGQARWTPEIAGLGDRIRAGDMALFLTDGFDEASAEAAERLAASGRDVRFLQILTADERDFPFDAGYRFRDPESGEERAGDGRALRARFLARFAQAQTALKARLERSGARCATHFIDESPDLALRALSAAPAR